MAERLSDLGLKPPSQGGESGQQKQEREARERDERLRQAMAEDARRDLERQQRLADEQPSPPDGSKEPAKKPPPPPSRKGRTDSVSQQAEAKRKVEDETNRQRLEQEGREDAIKKQQSAQEEQTRTLE